MNMTMDSEPKASMSISDLTNLPCIQSMPGPSTAIQNTTSSDQIDKYSATTAVLETNELLHHILTFIPKSRHRCIRRVSKTWKSTLFLIGRHLDPESVTPDGLSQPAYPKYENISINPAIYRHRGSCMRTMVFELECNFHSKLLYDFGHEFLTSPPVTQASIAIGLRAAVAMVRVRDGIRLWHLAEEFQKIMAGVPAGKKCAAGECKGHQMCVYIGHETRYRPHRLSKEERQKWGKLEKWMQKALRAL